MQYAAESLGLGSRWMQIRGNQYSEAKTSTEYIGELLGIPGNLTVLCIVAMGYPGEDLPPYRKEELLFNKVSYNRFGQRKA
jgi:nitroreductase